MWGLFGQVKGFIKPEKIWIDNNVFRLHHKATVVIFVTARCQSYKNCLTLSPTLRQQMLEHFLLLTKSCLI